MLAAVAEGTDLLENKQQAREGDTVASFAAEYLAWAAMIEQSRTLHDKTRRINQWILPAIRRKKLEDVAREDILRIHLARKDAPAEANHTI